MVKVVSSVVLKKTGLKVTLRVEINDRLTVDACIG